MKNPRSKSAILVFLLSSLLSPFVVHGTFQWDKDSLEDCQQREEAGQCMTDSVTFYQCPVSCTKLKKADGMRKQGEAQDPEDFFELKTPLANGKKLSMEKFEGYVTMVVVVPLYPGLAHYYHDMLEHVHKVYPFTLEIVIFPVRISAHPSVQLAMQPKKSKVIILPELKLDDENLVEPNAVLEYLEKTINPGADFIFTDRVTCYMISYNAGFIEKEDSPTLAFLEQWIQHYLGEMEWKMEL